MVQRCMSFIDKMPTEDHKACYIENRKEVCEKKIYLEVIPSHYFENNFKVEYARCCLMLVKQNEDEDKIEKAAKILQNVQVLIPPLIYFHLTPVSGGDLWIHG